MSRLADIDWRLKYTPEDGNLVRIFYIPVLEDAVRYDRLTGYFNAQALTLAARGIESLVCNNGHMRLIVGCTLDEPEIDAIQRGQKLQDLITQRAINAPLTPPDSTAQDALELLAWMVAHGFLEVKVAVPCDDSRNPIPADGIFHEKAGIIEDKVGDRLAWNGSLNETRSGWQHNWESINVFVSWGQEPQRVEEEEVNFARIWADKSKRVITIDVPTALRDDLMRFLPHDDRPARLKPRPLKAHAEQKLEPETGPPLPPLDLRRLVWGYIKYAPVFPTGGERVGEATAAVTPWPHQVRAFERLYHHWPPKLLIADEVGLGKTIQAGMMLRQAWVSGRAKRILILAPKAVLRQWQIELREKFNLNWPIYDGQKMVWCQSPAWQGKYEKVVGADVWHEEPVIIVSSHLMRRKNRTTQLLEQSAPWDLVVLDEAHHARRKAAGSATEGGPNALLRLMKGLKERAQGVVLLTATPMQVHPVEVWDLLNLLGLPPEWNERAFLKFFHDTDHPNPSQEQFESMARLFQSVERFYGEISEKEAERASQLTGFKTNRILRALRNDATIPRRQLEAKERTAAIRIMRSNTPIRQLVSRHTRELLRKYYKAGLLTTPIADRHVEDRFIHLTAAERTLYEAVEDYISTTYNQATLHQRNAVGFVMTIYRRRLASSFRALERTLQAHLESLGSNRLEAAAVARLDEDVPDEEELEDALDIDEAAALERQALALEERSEIETLLTQIRKLPPDTKLESLKAELLSLLSKGYRQVMVFTQFTDTMDSIREALNAIPDLGIMCFSGRGGEVLCSDGSWMLISRDDIKKRFRQGQADVLLCTDAAAEGLNFQFCGALINYDMPWNPMRVEQRIGRIDRLGQLYPVIQIVNLHYEGTVERDVYGALTNRIGLFQSVIGKLQPILSQLPKRIAGAILSGAANSTESRGAILDALEEEVKALEGTGFSLDEVTDADLEQPIRTESPLTFDDLEAVLRREDVLPPGTTAKALSPHQFAFNAPGMAAAVRVTTCPSFFEQHSESVELWSQGSPLFPRPDSVAELEELPSGQGLRGLLDDRNCGAHE